MNFPQLSEIVYIKLSDVNGDDGQNSMCAVIIFLRKKKAEKKINFLWELIRSHFGNTILPIIVI